MQNNYTYHKLVGSAIPERLHQIDSPPKQLFYVGTNPNEILAQPAASIVGTRKPSPYGREVTTTIVTQLAQRGVTIISGLALGIDSIAHQACLDNGGVTMAVLPCGPDRVYPSSHRHIAQRIIDSGGTLITEYPPVTPPLRQNFIARNRLVSGLGDVVVITEAADKSGTLHTVNFALNQAKTVMAVPGPITSPLSKGTNSALKSGALMVCEPADVLFELGISKAAPSTITATNKEEHAILSLLASGINDGHKLLAQSGLELSTYNQTLTMLELNGQIKPLGNNHWQRL